MNSVYRRLACLNLALLLLLLSAAPARAVPEGADSPAVLAEGVTATQPESPGEAGETGETGEAGGTGESGETDEAEPSGETAAPGEAGLPAEAPMAAAARSTLSSLWLYRNTSSSDYSSISANPYYISPYAPYYNYFDLEDYIFLPTSNAVQVGWYNRYVVTSTNLVPLTAGYLIRGGGSTSLNALWANYSGSSVILNALFGTFASSTASLDFLNQDRVTYQPYGTALPGTENYRVSGSGYGLLGWTTEYRPARDTDGVLTGRWYGVGDAAPGGVPVLYSHEYSTTNSSLVVYHPTLGTVKRGGALLVQGGLSSYTAVGAGELNAPAYHRFLGWSRTSGGTRVDCAAGSTVTPRAGTPAHLYAVWEDLGTPVGDGLYALLDPAARTVRLLAEPSSFPSGPFQAVLGLYRDGKLLDAAVSGLGSHSSEIKLEVSYSGAVPTEIKYFLMDGAGRPLRSAVTVPLSSLPL